MKVTDFILNTLVKHNVKHVFGITGGMITPLFDAFHGRKDIEYICNQHEQASAMAADGYARFAGLGCAIATSGPGATNLITGMGCSFFDSIPVIFITGNVNTKEARGNSGVRQRGFQETDIVSIVKPLTKYADMVTDPANVPYTLEYAIWRAQEGRPGPVLLDIPIDVLQAEIPEQTHHYIPQDPYEPNIDYDIERIVKLMEAAQKPVIIYGAGCRKYAKKLKELLDKTGFPCLPSWAALDVLPHDNPHYVSQFGVYGNRAGNMAVQNADFILAIGTRLDGRMTGNVASFAPGAVKVVVDLDYSEAQKVKPDIIICTDAGYFLSELLKRDIDPDDVEVIKWCEQIHIWKLKYPIASEANRHEGQLHPLDFVAALNDALPDDAIIVSDAGGNLSWVHQAIRIKGTQRLFSAYGYSPMGYALPASIGAHYATGKPVVCLIGDGGMQMNIQELQTLAHYQIPVKVFVMNNHSYGIIKQFQEEIFGGRYEATDDDHGYSLPDFDRIADAYDIESLRIDIPKYVSYTINRDGPQLQDIYLDPSARIMPKARFGKPLDQQWPYLDADDDEASPDEILERV